jgi:phosphoenolpyruvate carboxylase
MTSHREPERAFDEHVATRYRLYSGLLLGLPFDLLQRVGRLLPVFTEHCRKGLQQSEAPSAIVERFFAENPLLTDVAKDEALFLFLQLIERQIVLFDALEDASFTTLRDLDGAGSVSELIETVRRDHRQDDLAALLEQTATRIVLTAHPTQFYPDTVQHIIQDLRLALTNNHPADAERLLLQLGKTRFTNRERPTPIDEARGVLGALEGVFYDVLPEIAGRMLVAAHGREHLAEHLPSRPNLLVGFWPGGDRDGNPYVNADVTLEVARLLRERVLERHTLAAGSLARRLTFAGAHERIQTVRERLRVTWLSAAGHCDPALPTSPSNQPAYANAQELQSDLLGLREVIIRDHQRLFLDELDDLILKIHLFGFHFASLDLRQSSDVFFASLREVLLHWCDEAVLSRSERDIFERASCAQQIPLDLLNRLVDRVPALAPARCLGMSPDAKDTIDVLRLVPDVQERNGELGLHRVIISHTRGPEDVLVVVVLARLAGLSTERCEVDIVPLFESIDDLRHSHEILVQLFAAPAYSAWLGRRQRRQIVMLGFSDGTKDGGYFTANFSIRQARCQLTELGRSQGVRMIFFDGRGGPPARGGGNTHRFYRSRDSRIEQWETQLTIQGQTISSNFGSPEMAQYHVEQLFTANLENLLSPDRAYDPPQEFLPLMTDLSAISFRAYRELRDDPALLTLLGQKSPLPLFDHLTIASRPVKRKATQAIDLENLRAIPFVATWSILKIQIPGFYGLGVALQQMLDLGRAEELRQLYRNSRFFRALLDNAAMSLLKSRFDITAHLGRDPQVAQLWQKIRDEARTVEACILRISGQSRLLDNDPMNLASIRFREDMVLPLLVIVHDAVARFNSLSRQGRPDCEQAVAARKMALKGMAAVINATRNAA